MRSWLLSLILLAGCGTEPFGGWGFAEGPRDYAPDRVAQAGLEGQSWLRLDLSDHSTTRTTLAFDPDVMWVDYSHWDLFLDTQPEPIEDHPGTWTIDERGAVTMTWEFERAVTVTNTYVLVPAELASAMRPTPTETTFWPLGGYLAADRTASRFNKVWREERTSSTGDVWVEGGVSVELSFNAPLSELLGGGPCQMKMDVTVDRRDESGRFTVDQPCVVRRSGAAAEVLPTALVGVDDESEAWEAVLGNVPGAADLTSTWSVQNGTDPHLWFLPDNPHMLTSSDMWSAMERVDE